VEVTAPGIFKVGWEGRPGVMHCCSLGSSLMKGVAASHQGPWAIDCMQAY
jgi:hypothetical protein